MVGYVYLICNKNEDTYKIGVTRGDIKKRIKALQTGSSTELHITDWFESSVDPFKIEHKLHMKFFKNKVQGEWYRLENYDICHFQDICKEMEKQLKFLNENNTYINKDNFLI